jgi:hypothetical protein
MGIKLRTRMRQQRADKLLISRLDSMITQMNLLTSHARGLCPHKVDDTNVEANPDATTLATNQTLLNDIKSLYNTHRASTTYHAAADSTNTLATADQSDLATGQTLANAAKTAFNAHIILMSSHIVKDDSMTVTAANATDLASLIVLTNALKAAYNKHVNRTHLPATQVVTLDVDTP